MSADFFYKEAQRLKYVARSAFKLLEIQKKHALIRPGEPVLDLGCAPGAWLQVACQSLGASKCGGAVIGVDLKKVKLPLEYCDHRVRSLCADVMTLAPQVLADLCESEDGFSVILSDLCPAVSGIGSRDGALSGELGMRALELALGSTFSSSRHAISESESDLDLKCSGSSDNESKGLLRVGGSVVIKLLEGEESQRFPQICKGHFRTLLWYRPKATRPTSREIYLIAKKRIHPGG